LSDGEPLINLTAVARYLTYAYLPGAETLISGISKVLPGEVVEFRNGHLSFSRFWSLPAEAHGRTPDEECLRQQLRAELEAAVIRQLPQSGPVGAFLSGGLDSSLVVALARRLYKDEVLTYSVSFGPEYANELPFSSCVARHCRTRHHIVELSPAVVLRHLDESIAFLSDPVGDPLTVPNALLFREAAHQAGAVLNGEGGDPCFGGPKNVPMLGDPL
jgi:asparagine synthase (glutamine-hydrolysing)